jgi:2-hydroxycyclohexanecarboxyl-CoA dehydrogenase
MDRVAVVTGAASGIGAAICQHLKQAGHRVAVLDRDAAGAVRVAGSLGADARAVQVDVSDQSSVREAFAQVREELGAVHVLVTSAAISGFTPFGDIQLEEFERYVRINLTGTFHCLQAALPDMVDAGWGRIVTISSAAGQQGALQQGHYAATKGGVIAMTKTVALEYAAKGITANTIPPFSIATPLLRSAQESGAVPADKYLERVIPAGRVGTGDDIAAACAFLCSEAAGYITGQLIAVNGGALT